MTYDHDGALWVSWENGGPTWGKDFGAYAASVVLAMLAIVTLVAMTLLKPKEETR